MQIADFANIYVVKCRSKWAKNCRLQMNCFGLEDCRQEAQENVDLLIELFKCLMKFQKSEFC